MEAVFWLSLIGVIYSYALYPIALLIISRLSSSELSAEATQPPTYLNNHSVSHIVTVHNEQSRIREKIENSLAINYSHGTMEIIIASDCSTDDTEQIVESYADRQVRLVRADKHLGKEYAQKMAIATASGDILIFSDAATHIPADAFDRLILEFGNPKVGAVSSEDRFITENGQIAGEGAYVKYEMWLRSLEARVAGLVGLSGSFFAARKEVCRDWNIHSPSDFNTALNCNRLGYIAISSPAVLGYYRDVKDSRKEYRRKVRTVIRGLTSLACHGWVLNLFKSGLFGFQVWSHKVMRWAVPWFMGLAFLSNVAIAGSSWFYVLTLLIQCIGYLTVLIAVFNPELERFTPVKLALFFVQVNLAIAHATVAFFSGKRMSVWTPSQR